MKTLIRYCLIFILPLLFVNVTAKTISFTGNISNDATLKSIVLSTATSLVFSTGPSDFNYTTSVSPGTATLRIQPTTNDPAATVTVNGVAIASGAQSGQITLNGIVTTTINIVVTASDGVTISTYSIVVYETGSNNAFLSALTVSTGNALVSTPTGPGTFNYTTSVSPTTTSVTVTPTTADATASVSYNGTTFPSGTATPAIPLNATGTTTISVVVLAQDGVTTQTYSIIISKTGSNTATLSALSVSTGTPLTLISNFNYTTAVNNSVSSLKVTPTATDPTATITVNGTVVASGTPSGIILLNATGTTTISLVVTAQDGVTQTNYSIIVSKGATSTATYSTIVLSTRTSLAGIAPNLTTDVSPGTTSLTVTTTATDPNSTISVSVSGGAYAVVASGVASLPLALNTTGTTTITIQIKSQDATVTNTTNIVVSENGSNNASVSSIVLNPNSTLIGSTGSYNVNYTTSVNNTTNTVTVTPTPSDPTTTVTVNGVAVTITNGYTSSPIPLNATGTTLITIVLTSQDNTTRSYGITISKGGSNNANTNSIVLSTTVLNPAATLVGSIGSYNVNYIASVAASTNSLTVTTTPTDNQAKISVNGGAQIIGTSAVAVTLNTTGTTLITIVITSEDGTTTKSFGITVSKNGSNNANISSISLSTNTALTGSGTNSYTSIVSPHTTTVTVTTTTVDPNAKITVNGFAAPDAAPSATITLNTTGTTSLTILITAQDGVTTKSISITISKSGAIIAWTGAAGPTGAASWNTAGNWINTATNTAQVPAAGDVADFGVNPAYTITNQPTITASTNAAELEFGSNTILTVTGGLTLTVATSFTVDAGSSVTIKSSSGTAPVNIGPLATLNVAGTLTINSPVTFTLKSNASGSASVGQLTGTSSIVGTVNVERYIQGGSNIYRGYRLLSSPVHASIMANGNNIYSLNYVKLASLVTGNNAAGGFDKVGNPSLYLFREDEASNNGSFTGGNYWGISDLTLATSNLSLTQPPTYYFNGQTGAANAYNIPVGNGFMFFYRGDRTNVANKYLSVTSAESVTMTATGTLNAGQITVHDWYTPTSANVGFTNTPGSGTIQGLNLVGNPYASSIDWDTYNQSTPTSGIYAPQVGGAIYILDPVSKNYGVYIANSPFGGTNNATHIIPSGQGFFVHATASTAQLIFNEDAKTTVQVTGANLLLGTPVQNAVSQYLHLKLLQNAFQADEIFISFNNSSHTQFVDGEDAAQKPGFGIASLASMSSDGVPLSINGLKLPQQSESISLNVNASSDGTYQLAMPEIKSIPAIYDVWLMDAYKKDSVNLKQNAAYSFDITKNDTASYGSNRFSLVIRQNAALGLQLLSFTAARKTNGTQIVWKTVNEQNYTNFTVERSINEGKTFDVLDGFASSALGTYSFVDKYPAIGTDQYRLKLVDINGNISYSNVVTLLYSNLSNSIVSSNISVYPNPASNVINLTIAQNNDSTSNSNLSILQSVNTTPGLVSAGNSTQSYDIKIIAINGAVVKSVISQQPNWQDNVSNLSPGTYIIQVLNSNNKSLVGKSTFIKL